jgi:hypothetical protein
LSSCKPRSMPSTTSTTSNAPTKDCLGAPLRWPRGKRLPRPRRHAPNPTGHCSTDPRHAHGPRHQRRWTCPPTPTSEP